MRQPAEQRALPGARRRPARRHVGRLVPAEHGARRAEIADLAQPVLELCELGFRRGAWNGRNSCSAKRAHPSTAPWHDHASRDGLPLPMVREEGAFRRSSAAAFAAAALRLAARALRRLPFGILVPLGFERRRVRQLLLLGVHHQLYVTALRVVRHLQTIELHRDALLADAEEAADTDHEAVDRLGVLAEYQIADAADLGFVGRIDRLANELLGENGIGVLHDDLAGNRRLGDVAAGRCRRRGPLLRHCRLRDCATHAEQQHQGCHAGSCLERHGVYLRNCPCGSCEATRD